MRNKIYTIKWSTNPADLGYGGKPTNWDAEKSDARGTAETCLRKFKEWHKKIGLSTYVARRMYYRGKPVSIIDFDNDAERIGYEREYGNIMRA